MVRTKLAKIDVNLIDVFGKISKEFAAKIKKEYNLTEITIPNTLASQLMAGKYNGKKSFNFKVEKTGLTKGVLKLV